MASAKGANKAFVFMNDQDKTDPVNRKLIRKYVMLGKNRGKARSKAPKATSSDSESPNSDQSDTPGLVINMGYSMIPNQVGNDLSFTRLAEPVEPILVHDILKRKLTHYPKNRTASLRLRTVAFMAKKILFPLERCIRFHKTTKVDTVWFDLLTCDAAYMHAVIFSSQVYSALISTQDNQVASRRAMVHHSKTLSLLQERLQSADQRVHISDSTILIVLHLANQAHLTNNYRSARFHINGLRKMIDMRGGLNSFSYNTKLIIEVLKCDLGIAIHNGTEPLFFRDPFNEPLIPYTKTISAPEDRLDLVLHPDIAEAWTAMKRFCCTINTAAQQNTQLDKEILLEIMGSVVYRMLDMSDFESGSVDQTIRLGILVFSCHILLDTRDIKLPHTYFRNKYQECLQQFIMMHSEVSPFISLWLLMIGSISLFTGNDSWTTPQLKSTLELRGSPTWEIVHTEMKRLLWIDFLHDRPAKATFDSVTVTPD